MFPLSASSFASGSQRKLRSSAKDAELREDAAAASGSDGQPLAGSRSPSHRDHRGEARRCAPPFPRERNSFFYRPKSLHFSAAIIISSISLFIYSASEHFFFSPSAPPSGASQRVPAAPGVDAPRGAPCSRALRAAPLPRLGDGAG